VVAEENGMATYPADLRYTREHEWARAEGTRARVGITHYAQDQLGDVVFVELPKVGARVRQMQSFGVVESVKAVSDLFAPLSGEVVEVNQALVEHPEQVNQDPYGAGWMLVITMSDAKELDALMSAGDYEAYLETAGAGGH
jgi:glycine cleavage system H protein